MIRPRGASLRRGILVPAIGAGVLFFCCATAALIWLGRAHLEFETAERLRGFNGILNREIEVGKAQLVDALQSVADSPEVTAPWTAGDDTRLAAVAVPLFQRLRSRSGITRLTFIGPDGTCRFRAHDPDRYGDSLGLLIQAAAARGDLVHGIVTTPVGPMEHRAVLPWRAGGETLGFLEATRPFDELPRYLSELAPGQILTVVRRSARVDAKLLESGVTYPGDSRNVVLGDVSPELAEPVLEWLGRISDAGATGLHVPVLVFTAGDVSYHGGRITIPSFTDEVETSYILLHDISVEKRALASATRAAALAYMAIGCGVLLLFLRQIRRVEMQLAEAGAALQEENQRRRESEMLLEKHAAELEDTVAARTQSLSEANVLLEKRIQEAEELNERVTESETLARNVLDSMFTFVGMVDLDGHIVSANQAPLRAVGVEFEDVAGKLFWETPWWSHSEAEQERLKTFLASAAAGENRREVVTNQLADGSVITIDASFAPLRDPHGRVYGVVASGVDITDRVNAYKALEYIATTGDTGEAFFQALVRALAEALGARFAVASEFYMDGDTAMGRVLGFSRDGEEVPCDDYALEGTPCAGVRVEGVVTVDSGVAAQYPDDLFFREVRADGYCGIALRGVDGTAIGQICVFDSRPIESDSTKGVISAFAARASAELQRLRSEQALRVNEERYRLVIQGTNDGIWDWDIPTDECYVSARWKQILGYVHDSSGLDADTFFDMIHPEDRGRTEAALTAHLKHREPYDLELRLRHGDGGYRWVHARGEAVRDSTGEATRMVGAITDVTETRRITRELRESEKRLRLAESLAGTGYFGMDTDGSHNVWSDGLLKIWGLPPGAKPTFDQLMSQVHPDDREHALAALNQSVSGQQGLDVQYRLRMADGSQKTARCVAIYDPADPPRIFGTVIDLTEFLEAQAALQESERRLKHAEGIARMGHYWFTTDLSVAEWSDGLLDLWGVPKDGEHTIEGLLGQLHPEDSKRTMKELADAAAEQRGFDLQYRIIRPDGDVRTLNSIGTYVASDPPAFFGALVDISDIVHAQEALRVSEQRLRYAEILARTGHYQFTTDRKEPQWSRGFLELWGSDPDSLPTVDELLARLHPDDFGPTLEEYERACEEERGYDLQYRIIRPDGDELTIRSVAEYVPGAPPRFFGTVMDITGLVRTEKALRTSERRLRLIFDNMSDLQFLFRVEEGGRLVYEAVNHANMESIRRNFPGKPVDPTGMERTEYLALLELPQEFIDNANRLYTEILETKKARQLELEIPAAAHPIVLDCSLVPVLDGVGRCTHILWTARDITVRRQQEAALRRERDFNESLINTVPAALVFLDLEGRIQHINPWLEELSGWKNAEIQGKDWFTTFLPERDQVRIKHLFVQASQDVNAHGNTNPIVTRSGEERQIEWYDQVLRDDQGDTAGVMAVGLDVTERKRAEDALRENEERLRQAVRVSEIGIFDHDHDADTIYWSPRQREIHGWGRDELVSLPAFIDLVHPDDMAHIDAEVRRAHDPSGDGTWDVDHRIVRRDGTVRWLTARSRTFFEGEGSERRPVRTVGAVRDVTEEREIQQELDRHREHLEELVEERTVQIKRLDSELIAASRRAGMAEVATGVLHNVGNVLNSVNVSAELAVESVSGFRSGEMSRAVDLLEGHRKELADFVANDPQGSQVLPFLKMLASDMERRKQEVREELDVLRQNIEHIKHIVGMQQDYARARGVPEETSAGQLLQEAEAILGVSKGATTTAPEFEACNGPVMYIEKHKVLQILVNLLQNACDAVAGQVGREPVVRVHVERPSRESVMFVVQDNGRGIDPENLDRIFSLGFTTKENGSGFGLHVSAVAAAELGGELTVSSEGLGRGARFALTLPTGSPKGTEHAGG